MKKLLSLLKPGVKGVTLVELMLGVLILSFTLTGIISVFVNSRYLSEMQRDSNLAYNSVQSKMEEVKSANFTCLSTSSCTENSPCDCPTTVSCPSGCASCYRNQGTFEVGGIASGRSKGFMAITSQSTNLTRVRVVVAYKVGNRVVGEDSNLNGFLDAGEDVNGNGQLDSPVELDTLITR